MARTKEAASSVKDDSKPEKVRKELKVRQAERSPHLYEVYYDNGGELPAVLAGALFTDVDRANEAIREYLDDRDNK